MSPYKLHLEKWKNGCGSVLCGGTDGLGCGVRIVFARGTIPCDIVFIGEAPGKSENVLGKPFVGPAGKLLDRIIDRTIGKYNRNLTEGAAPLTYAMTNLVGCIPLDSKGDKTEEPSHDDIQACRPRLEEFVGLCSPRLVVAVGKLAEEYLSPGFSHSVKLSGNPWLRKIHHPAAILRANVALQGLMTQSCVVQINHGIADMYSHPGKIAKSISRD